MTSADVDPEVTLISARAARARLQRAGVTDRQARLVLASGLHHAAQRLVLLQDGWDDLSVWYRIMIAFHVQNRGPLPFLATVGGFVYLGASVVDIGPAAHLKLGDPGPWFERLRHARVRTGPGRPWHLRIGSAAVNKAAVSTGASRAG